MLKPVFNIALEEYKKRGDSGQLEYERWVNNNLNIKFEEGTQVLKISFNDLEKDFIIEILNQISRRYQNYSKQIKEKELMKTLMYLSTQQKSLKEISENSLKVLNSFSLKHGLGNLDGFIDSASSNIRALNTAQINSNLKNQAGQRYVVQFKTLERLEAELVNYSTKLKPNSQLIKSLKLKIETLKESLKRPREILLTYRDLTKEAFRDEALLNDIETQLGVIKLEIAKQRDPWELISEPTIAKDRVSPQRKKMTSLGFISSLFIASLISIVKEKRSGKVFELNELASLLDCKYIDTFYLNNDNLNQRIIEDEIKSENRNQKINKISQKFNIIKFTKEDTNLFIKDCRFIKFKYEDIEKNDNLFFLISPGMITSNQIILINKYIKINRDKFIGWIYLNDQKFS